MPRDQFDRDEFGLPILPFDQCVEAQFELGLGLLHTQFDDQGFAYTSLFLDSAVARWSLGRPYREDGWKLVEKLPVQYNIGHPAAVEGDTAKPAGTFLVALNKWSVDRFPVMEPLLPQNAQLIVIEAGKPMVVLYDAPVGLGEPHYAQIIKRERIKAWEVYPEVGWDPATRQVDPNAPKRLAEARIERRGRTVEVWATLMRSNIRPDVVEVQQGDEVIWHLTNIERARDATHGFALGGYNINLSLQPGETETLRFVADMPGTFPFYCTESCSALHLEMMGYFPQPRLTDPAPLVVPPTPPAAVRDLPPDPAPYYRVGGLLMGASLIILGTPWLRGRAGTARRLLPAAPTAAPQEGAVIRVKALSGGMQQKLILASALVGSPPILLLDEPTAKLDPEARAELLKHLRTLRDQGRTVVFTSHREDEVRQLATRVIRLEGGRKVGELVPPPVRRVSLRLLLDEGTVEAAAGLLQTHGFDVRRNGRSLRVAVEAARKAEPFFILGRAGLKVRDFALEDDGGSG